MCNMCKHLSPNVEIDDENVRTIHYCQAYPDGIPDAVYEAGHIYPKPGDHGIQFEASDGGGVPERWQQSQAEEDKTYNWYANYYSELDMTDEEFTAKMKREHGKNWHMYKKPSRDTFFD